MARDIMSFAREALSVPFRPHGRDGRGWDCWGLVLAAYREVLGVELHDYAGAYGTLRDEAQLRKLFRDRHKEETWHSVVPGRECPPDLACVIMKGRAIHVGLLLPGGRLLHTERGVGTVVEPVGDLRVEGYYRHWSQR